MLKEINPDQAMQDPVIVQNVPYFKAQQRIQAEVNQLEVPPRPADWGVCSSLTRLLILNKVHECVVDMNESSGMSGALEQGNSA